MIPLQYDQDFNLCDTKLLNTSGYPLLLCPFSTQINRVQSAAGLQVEVKADSAAGDQKIPSRTSQDRHSHRSLLGIWQGLVLTQGSTASICWLEYPMQFCVSYSKGVLHFFLWTWKDCRTRELTEWRAHSYFSFQCSSDGLTQISQSVVFNKES